MSSSSSYDYDLHDDEMEIACSDGDDEMEMDFLRERYQEDNKNYDVFLSFRGEDTRASFTSHLYSALHNAGIFVFKDDERLPRGSKISPSLRLAIEESRVSVVVFSRHYAESRWCLEELEKIMECHRTTGHVVVPVFYDVDPSEVRHQTGHFGKEFQNLENRLLKVKEEKQLRWRKTLDESAGISGLSVVRNCNGIIEIVDKIYLLAQHWSEALREAAGIFGGSVSKFRKMDLANKIDHFVERWRDGLCVAIFTPCGEMETANKIDLLVKHWSEALCEAAGISGGADLNSKGEMKLANDINLLVKHWREALCEAADISGGVVFDYPAGISGGVVLNSSVEEKIRRDFEVMVKHWREALCEAADISGSVVLNSRRSEEILRSL